MFEEIKTGLDSEFESLLCNPRCTVKCGDSVLLHAGLLRRGFYWERIQGVVVAISETSVRVKYKKDYDKEYTDEWIHPALIIEVIGNF